MLSSYGLYTHIRANHIRSVALICVLFALIGGLTLAIAIAITGFDAKIPPEQFFDEALARAGLMIPYAALGATAWLGVGLAFNREMASGMSGAEFVSRTTHPRLYNLLENLCITRGITMPRLEIIHAQELNAFASGMTEEQYTVTVTEGLLNRLSDEEIEAVLAHELTHIRNRDVTMMVLAVIIVGMIATVGEFILRVMLRSIFHPTTSTRRKGGKPGAIVGILAAIGLIAITWLVSQLAFFALSRRREYLADAGAVELTRNPDAMIGALRKIAGHSNVEALPANMMHMCIDNPRRGLTSLFATHPSIEDRISALVAYADGRADLVASHARRPLGNEAKAPRQASQHAPPCEGAASPWGAAGPWGPAGAIGAAVLVSAQDQRPDPPRAAFGRRRPGTLQA